MNSDLYLEWVVIIGAVISLPFRLPEVQEKVTKSLLHAPSPSS